MSDEGKKPKIGAGHASAWLRAGNKEFAQALVALPTSTIRPVEEPGLAGNPTQSEVAQGKGAYEVMLGNHAARGPERQTPEREMER